MKTSTTREQSGLNRMLCTWLVTYDLPTIVLMNVPTYGTAGWSRNSFRLADPVVYTTYVMYKVFSFVPECSRGLWTM